MDNDYEHQISRYSLDNDFKLSRISLNTTYNNFERSFHTIHDEGNTQFNNNFETNSIITSSHRKTYQG